MPTVFTVRAPAKINLSLQVLGKFANGYHDLDSWMLKLDLADTLTITLGQNEGIRLECPGTNLPCGSANLVWQAAKKFYDMVGRSAALDIILEKKIPVAAGLGGGSSDAGCLLTFLNEQYGMPLDQQTLLDLAQSIGADLPFFVSPLISARARGIGEKLNAIPPLENCFFVLVNPGFSVSTAWVFAQTHPPYSSQPLLDEIFDNSVQSVNYALTMGGKTTILGRALHSASQKVSLQNDLERITISRYPEIQVIKDLLQQHGACYTAMSGSGPTVFGIFADFSTSQSAEKHVSAIKHNATTFLTQVYQDN